MHISFNLCLLKFYSISTKKENDGHKTDITFFSFTLVDAAAADDDTSTGQSTDSCD